MIEKQIAKIKSRKKKCRKNLKRDIYTNTIKFTLLLLSFNLDVGKVCKIKQWR